MKVGIVLNDKERDVFAKTISKFFDTYVYLLPELPHVLDEDIYIPEDIFKTDIILSYAFHPNVNLEIIKRAERYGVKIVLIAGKFKFKSSKVRVIVDDVCCSRIVKGFEFFEKFGIPEFDVDIRDGKVEDVRVIRSAPCGATFFVAEMLKGVDVESAPRRAGLLAQIRCFSSRGIGGGIHKAGAIHKLAIERAIRRKI